MKIAVEKFRLSPGQTQKLELNKKNIPADRVLDLEFVDELKTRFNVVNNNGRIEVSGIVETSVRMSCSRCLENFVYPLKADFTGLIVFNEAEKEQLEEVSPVLWLAYSEELDLTDFLVETVALHLPWVPVCSSQCAGLCTECGQNLNRIQCQCLAETIDPRLEKLKELQFLHNLGEGR